MGISQFAVYQLKDIPENREIRFRSYKALQEKKNQVRYKDYEQVYLGQMHPKDGPDVIRERLGRRLPRTFKGHAISVSDVFVLNKTGAVSSYYVEKNGFTVLPGFIWNSSSSAPVSLDTTGFHIEGKAGGWLAFDSIIMDGKEFFLMEHEKYGKEAAWAVVDEGGNLVVDHVCHGFDQAVLQQIQDYLTPPQTAMEPVGRETSVGPTIMLPDNNQKKPPLENWQKYMEHGEYLRSSEMEEEQNYNMIDGRRNNMSPEGRNGRKSVLAKLRYKQVVIAKRSGKDVQQ